MRKLIAFIALSISCIVANAQKDIFNHLGVAVGVGTTGITAELGTTITPWVQLRAGVDIMPKFKINTDLSLEEFDVADYLGNYDFPYVDEIGVEGKITNTTGHFVFDVFPFTNHSSFHISVGGYFGKGQIISANNTDQFEALKAVYQFNHRLGIYEDIPGSAGKIGAALGDYFIEPNQQGELGASIRVNSFRPYVGLGFGRIVPKSRINCLFDLGVQFWGKPQVWDDSSNMRITSEGANGDDGGAIKIISKISAFPVLSIKLVGKIF